ncbi:PAS and helix-turn-helix domain-containing protein [Aliiroseovarius subalbicans]|uniref:LuxR C-terminal-related transcriptional regulator n=1 Tax=Aliiroseovarius subalbicans TaxID=2925840 RepID=UPI001F5A2BBF|nr:PAS and helix-turn-helix domain-containing protein [Aliiroseovarius subalbicans]MCI2399012.1 LuxR C-terminal-related transcriptional regulator [Aliiroseovarius subalbicans]
MESSDLAFTHAPIGLALTEDRIVKRANLRFGEVFGDTPEHFANTPLARLYPSSQDYEQIGARGAQILRETGRYEDERVMRRLDGALFWCRVRGQSLTPDDPFKRGVWSFVDLSSERPVVELTPREREVAILTCQGLTSKEIGLALDLSYRTVEAHRARLLEKFGARKLPELVAKFSGMPL